MSTKLEDDFRVAFDRAIEGAITPEVRKELEGNGYKFTENRPWGSDEAIIIGSKSGKRVLYGANDGRATAGAAVGN